MSINWVMVSPESTEPFVKLPNERILYRSPIRTSLTLSSPSNTHSSTQPWSVSSDGGVAYITNQRIVYIPTTSSPSLTSFSCPILNLHDTYVRAPFFGANYWTASVRPVAGGGTPPSLALIDLRMTFREGGAFDYHNVFELIKERLYEAVQAARDAGRNVGGAGGMDPEVLQGLHLEQLPAYEPAAVAPGSGAAAEARRASVVDGQPRTEPESAAAQPDEPPPGYEEAQAQAVGIDLDQRLRRRAEFDRDSGDE
ncbi:hypothetical protein VC83_06482 [Pseudogymnoascus destructans]|uniref:Uncharacterized protein n=2 Tax=Pseudogymnoascus destructans TaxID=655981 RepID=L8G9W0_PSED2|nr:uncharacterized protein VC83_06482 [Pseudogymnoascus destructans]ELR09867.1 hypothetical protein GMDG_04347 [Pseudogymnoascus destructans 20631-21]OAF58245.2 hypothetical protein VC83_06482 [Pseudogymnoascus destructans]